MRRERGDDSNKGDITLVYKSQKCKSFKKNMRNKSQDICNVAKRKVTRRNNVQNKKKTKKSRKLKKKLITHRKMSMETILLTIQVKKLLLQLC